MFSAVAFPTTRKGCPEGAGPDADPLGPCMPNVTHVKQQLALLPAGARALTLEADDGIYYLQDPNASANRWGGMASNCACHFPSLASCSALTPALAADYMDTLAGSGRVQGPWADVYKTAMKKRVTAWFAELKRIGGEVDLVLSDFEMGFHSSSYNWAHQPTADGSDPVDALLADPRWPALQAQLNHAGAPYGVNFSTASMRTMAEWHQRDWRMTVWGRVVPTLYVAALLNASVFAPIAASFPAVRFSNFAHSHHTDPSGVVSPSSLGTIWAEAEVVIGLGAHVGTHQSTAFCKHFPCCWFSVAVCS